MNAYCEHSCKLSKTNLVSKGQNMIFTKNLWVKYGILNDTMGKIDNITWMEEQDTRALL